MVPALESWTLRLCISPGDFLCFLWFGHKHWQARRPCYRLLLPTPFMYMQHSAEIWFLILTWFFFLFFHNPVLLYKLFQSLNGAESMQSFLVIASPKSSINLVTGWGTTPHLQANWPSGWTWKLSIRNPLWKITLWCRVNCKIYNGTASC